ncbi:MAG: DUF4038 domain-containing protein [Armatimonadetes bacterium]|nr:DUF4038 domain-containing protein [Armatimonadota bacterium]
MTQTACYGLQEAPGAAFAYNDWMMALLWDTLFLGVYGATYGDVDRTVLRPRLTDALGCEDDPTFMAFGERDRPGRLAVSPRDFARFGLLYLRGGKWGDEQLLREDLARMAVTSPLPNSLPRASADAAPMIAGQRTIGSRAVPDNQCDHLGSYSFLWWTNGVDRGGRRHWPAAPLDAYGAFGHGGPRAMVVVPSLDAIISWNDALVNSPEAESEALRLLTEACLDRDPSLGHLVADPEAPHLLCRRGGGPIVVCGPGDPEGFLYRGAANPDGTRNGDQQALIDKLAATGANCLYVQVVRSHGGDGDATQNPFVSHDPAQGVNEAVLTQWDRWLTDLDQAGVVTHLFLYDDGARVWNTGDEVGPAERGFIERLARRFGRHHNLVWCLAEEYEERYTPARISNLARTIREADNYNHPIGVHKLHGLDFREFAEDPNIDQFCLQYNVDSAEELHTGLLRARRDAQGRYGLNLSECAGMGTGAELRGKLWACAMAGASVMVLGMDIASTPPEDLYACGRLVRFLEGTDWARLTPHDELARGATRYVLADPGRSYVAYAPVAGEVGLAGLQAGTYSLTWMDCATGGMAHVPVAGVGDGETAWWRPGTVGGEAALHMQRIE